MAGPRPRGQSPQQGWLVAVLDVRGHERREVDGFPYLRPPDGECRETRANRWRWGSLGPLGMAELRAHTTVLTTLGSVIRGHITLERSADQGTETQQRGPCYIVNHSPAPLFLSFFGCGFLFLRDGSASPSRGNICVRGSRATENRTIANTGLGRSGTEKGTGFVLDWVRGQDSVLLDISVDRQKPPAVRRGGGRGGYRERRLCEPRLAGLHTSIMAGRMSR